jgi:asparagine synthase (glutamine-hydrolysing)
VREYADQHLALTEGLHSWMHGHGISTLAAAREVMDVNLSGWDGGTILGGHLADHQTDDRFRAAPGELTLAQRLYDGFCATFTWPGATEAEAASLFSAPGDAALRGLAFDSFREELTRTAHYPAPYRADYFYLLQHCRRSTQNMVVFARSAIEVRCPFFDYDLVSFLYGLPLHLRASPEVQRRVLTRRMPDLARIPNEKDNLPPHSSRGIRLAHRGLGRARRVANRVVPRWPDRTRLYADYEEYLRGDLRDWAEAILFSPRAAARGLLNPAAVRQLWERHQRGDQHWTIGAVAPLITLELVQRQLFDTDHSGAIVPDLPAATTSAP